MRCWLAFKPPKSLLDGEWLCCLLTTCPMQCCKGTQVHRLNPFSCIVMFLHVDTNNCTFTPMTPCIYCRFSCIIQASVNTPFSVLLPTEFCFFFCSEVMSLHLVVSYSLVQWQISIIQQLPFKPSPVQVVCTLSNICQLYYQGCRHGP